MVAELPVVAVRGEAHLEVSPEIARVRANVTARETERARALETVSARQRAVRSVLDEFTDSLEDVETSRVYVAPVYPKRGQGEVVVGFAAEVVYTLTLADLDQVGELLARLAEVDSARVDGPYWDLRPSSPAHAQARRAAIDDALVRAGNYAAALGSRLAGLLRVADSGLDDRPQPPSWGMESVALAAPTAAGGPPAFDVESGQQTVRATVEAQFTITTPTLPQPTE